MSQQENQKIFDRVKRYREKAGLTQPQLAELLGISANYVYQIEAKTKHSGPSVILLFEQLESGKLVKGESDRFGEESGPYKATVDLTVMDDAWLQKLKDHFTNESRASDLGAEIKIKLIKSLRAIVEELERRNT